MKILLFLILILMIFTVTASDSIVLKKQTIQISELQKIDDFNRRLEEVMGYKIIDEGVN